MAYAYTDASLAASGVSQPILPFNNSRECVRLSNPHATITWWINETGGAAAANAAGSIALPALTTIILTGGNAITGIATAATPLTVSWR